jgi:dynein heavy chain 1
VYEPARLVELVEKIKEVADHQHLVTSDLWMTKILQLYQIQSIHHGVMMVGSSGSGKSTAWRVLLEALGKLDGVEGVSYVIDPKVMSKDALYGTLDSTTREWTDGLFTQVLRKIIDNVRGEGEKRHWIIFDGDVDPIWVENLNRWLFHCIYADSSVLDDNKMLTLPNGERLNLPSTVRIMFEVESLKYATPATVSRCGMVWFSGDIIDSQMLVRHYSELLKHSVFEDLDEDGVSASLQPTSTARDTQGVVVEISGKYFSSAFISKALQRAKEFDHIMEFTDTRALNTLFSLIQRACHTVLEYNEQHSDFPLEYDQIEHFISRKLLLCFIWSFAGDCPLDVRQTFGDFIANMTTITVPMGPTLLDFNVVLPSATWDPWQDSVPERDVDPQDVNTSDTVIPTIDTVRHEEVLYSWMSEHRPVILCGPPGSGKTMTLFNALRKLPNFEVASINFSSATTPDLIIKSLEQYCEYRKTMNGTILSPAQIGRWLVLFCDEINLPAPDTYGTQRVISFMRQLVEQGGFWRTSNRTWITLERIQFVGACNPPTDAGRVALSPRFLRHSPVIMVDYPGKPSLHQIYFTFVRGVLKCAPDLRGFADAVTQAMVEFYLRSQKKYTASVQSHYIYSPRELTRWIRGIYESIRPLEGLRLEDLVRIWAHEALRLFQDRLVGEEERVWTRDNIFSIAEEHFPGLDLSVALAEPIMFSNWLSKYYVAVDREILRDFTKSRLKTFCEEDTNTRLRSPGLSPG